MLDILLASLGVVLLVYAIWYILSYDVIGRYE